jgi:hypothetical protein
LNSAAFSDEILIEILEEFCSNLKNSEEVEIIPIKYEPWHDKRNTDEAIQLVLDF